MNKQPKKQEHTIRPQTTNAIKEQTMSVSKPTGRFQNPFPPSLSSSSSSQNLRKPIVAFFSEGMARTTTKLIFGLIILVATLMITGSLFQLAIIHQLEESSGNSHWKHDKEATALRLGFVKPEILSWSPRIILFRNFLSSEECDFLRAIARPRLHISTVVDTKTGKGIKSDVRTSSGMFLSSAERKYPIVQAIEKRISVFSQVPSENGELIQVLRYEANQYYKPHHDYFSDTFNLKRGGQRVATMLMYLSDNVEGGETHFPLAGDGECSCGGTTVKGLCVKPNKGDAVLFWSMGLDGESDSKSVHGGCAVLKGEKWSATKWMRQRTTY